MTKQPSQKHLRGQFGACACGTGAGVGAMIASHAGCVAGPALLAALGLTAAGAVGLTAAFALSAASGLGSYLLWRKLRGKAARPLERNIARAGAIGGALMSLAMHFGLAGGSGHHGHHGEHHHHAPETQSSATSSSTPKITAFKSSLMSSRHSAASAK